MKKKKRETQVTGFIMGSEKIYSLTANGYLIVSSALSGKVESYTKIGDSMTSPTIIAGGKLFVYTEDSKILGFN